MAEKRNLKKELGALSATSVVVGCVIGAGVFFKPYAIYQATGGAPGMGMLAWIIGGLASIFAAVDLCRSCGADSQNGRHGRLPERSLR